MYGLVSSSSSSRSIKVQKPNSRSPERSSIACADCSGRRCRVLIIGARRLSRRTPVRNCDIEFAAWPARSLSLRCLSPQVYSDAARAGAVRRIHRFDGDTVRAGWHHLVRVPHLHRLVRTELRQRAIALEGNSHLTTRRDDQCSRDVQFAVALRRSGLPDQLWVRVSSPTGPDSAGGRPGHRNLGVGGTARRGSSDGLGSLRIPVSP